ncbi:Disease resistance-like protein DSC1 [Glycine soja]|uniref:Disease resistance-like protein DSC1 n=2 Tax=Glycine soja TaxID=3848 RepID=A0A445FS52_GLYSO|nr:Disease resistance-like protein DSC1 [Glycine soja]
MIRSYSGSHQAGSPSEPRKRSRLWLYENIVDVLENDKGTDTIEVIMLHLPKNKEVRWNGSELKKMTNLKLLSIENAHFSRGPEHLPSSLRVPKWWGYPSPSLPPEFDPRRLDMLDLSKTCNILSKQLKIMNFESLSEMVLRGCTFIKQAPDIAIGCINLRILPHNFKLTSLEYLSLTKCSSLQCLPNILEEMKHVKNLDLSGTAIEEFPLSFRKLTGLKYLVLDKCKMLNKISTSILMLPKLKRLMAVQCGRYVNLILGKSEGQVRLSSSKSLRDVRLNYNDLAPASFPNVEFLVLTGNAFKVLPECISQCRFLKNLVLDNCKEL